MGKSETDDTRGCGDAAGSGRFDRSRPARANSNTIWYEGQITDGPWSGEPRRMAVNGVTFSLMPDAPVYRRTTNFSGITQQGAISFRDLRKGQQVMIRIQGHRIYQVIVLK